jgi:hypothetical protein
MATRKLITQDLKSKIWARMSEGVIGKDLSKEFGVSSATLTRIRKEFSSKKVIPQPSNSHRFQDIPLHSPTIPKVAIIITDANSAAKVLGDLWK